MKIIFTEPCGRELKKLKKKYPNIKNDLNELLSALEAGSESGVPIPGLFNSTKSLKSEPLHLI